MGDRAWKKLLEQHQRVVHAVVERWHGQNVEFAGDGVMRFRRPTPALRCAFELVAAARDLDIEIRAGIHTGEIERGETGVGGIGVHIAARVLAAAGPGQVVVTKTVRDLATGTDLTFTPLGSRNCGACPVNGSCSRRERRSAEPGVTRRRCRTSRARPVGRSGASRRTASTRSTSSRSCVWPCSGNSRRPSPTTTGATAG